MIKLTKLYCLYDSILFNDTYLFTRVGLQCFILYKYKGKGLYSVFISTYSPIGGSSKSTAVIIRDHLLEKQYSDIISGGKQKRLKSDVRRGFSVESTNSGTYTVELDESILLKPEYDDRVAKEIVKEHAPMFLEFVDYFKRFVLPARVLLYKDIDSIRDIAEDYEFMVNARKVSSYDVNNTYLEGDKFEFYYRIIEFSNDGFLYLNNLCDRKLYQLD